MLNSEFIKDKFFDKYIYKVEFAEMLRIVPGNLQECYLFFSEKIAEFAIILELNGYSDCLKIR